MAQPREPTGSIKKSTQVRTNGQAFDLMLDLEDVDYLHEIDKVKIVEFVDKAMTRIALARNPCWWFEISCRRNAKALDKAK